MVSTSIGLVIVWTGELGRTMPIYTTLNAVTETFSTLCAAYSGIRHCDRGRQYVAHRTFAKKNAGALAAKEAASWAHRKAAEENTSVSRLVGSMLERQMLQEDGYTEARQQWSKLKPMNLDAAHRLSREDANAR
jgi:hypothetical protein